MVELKAFRKENGLLQKDVADYLGVSREFVSLAESGKAPFPYNHLRKLLDNDKGWNVSMLSGDCLLNEHSDEGKEKRTDNTFSEVLALRKEIELLRVQLEETKAEKAQYWEMIKELTKK